MRDILILQKGENSMGYATDFNGWFNTDRKLSNDEISFLNAFKEGRHMTRSDIVLEKMRDEKDPSFNQKLYDLIVKLGLPFKSKYYVGKEDFGQKLDSSILDYNLPGEAPGLWLQWEPRPDGEGIQWDGGEKFYEYVNWLQFLIDEFFKPWGIMLDGSVEYRGQDWDDTGYIIVTDNIITVQAR